MTTSDHDEWLITFSDNENVEHYSNEHEARARQEQLADQGIGSQLTHIAWRYVAQPIRWISGKVKVDG